jgi:hypothetical protein
LGFEIDQLECEKVDHALCALLNELKNASYKFLHYHFAVVDRALFELLFNFYQHLLELGGLFEHLSKLREHLGPQRA